jgi:hypothetical protein
VSVIPALGRQRQEDWEFKASWGYKRELVQSQHEIQSETLSQQTKQVNQYKQTKNQIKTKKQFVKNDCVFVKENDTCLYIGKNTWKDLYPCRQLLTSGSKMRGLSIFYSYLIF